MAPNTRVTISYGRVYAPVMRVSLGLSVVLDGTLIPAEIDIAVSFHDVETFLGSRKCPELEVRKK